MKIYVILICLIKSLTLYSQYQISSTNDQNFTRSSLSDEFNNSRNSIWKDISGDSYWGQEYFKSDQIGYYSADYKHLLRLTAKNWNDTVFSGGIVLKENSTLNNTHYGYYEIEARVLEIGENSRLWPAFWLHKGDDNSTPTYYEETDILEPSYDQLLDGEHEIGVHYNQDTLHGHRYIIAIVGGDTIYNQKKIRGSILDVDFSQWHKYGVFWSQTSISFFFDGKLFYSITENVPSHSKQNVYLDLQVMNGDGLPDGILGYFDINYFHYDTLKYSTDYISSSEGYGYNFDNHINEVKISCDFSHTTVNSNKVIRFKDYVVLHDEFVLDLTNNRDFILMPTE